MRSDSQKENRILENGGRIRSEIAMAGPMRMTRTEFEALKASVEQRRLAKRRPAAILIEKTTQDSTPAKKKGKKRREMNKTEREFSMILDARKRAGEIIDWNYEGTTFRWGTLDCIAYTPDFTIIEGAIQRSKEGGKVKEYLKMVFVETKGGRIWPKDIQKFKAARNQFPLFEFQLHQKTKSGWQQLY